MKFCSHTTAKSRLAKLAVFVLTNDVSKLPRYAQALGRQIDGDKCSMHDDCDMCALASFAIYGDPFEQLSTRLTRIPWRISHWLDLIPLADPVGVTIKHTPAFEENGRYCYTDDDRLAPDASVVYVFGTKYVREVVEYLLDPDLSSTEFAVRVLRVLNTSNWKHESWMDAAPGRVRALMYRLPWIGKRMLLKQLLYAASFVDMWVSVKAAIRRLGEQDSDI